ncbi:MAG: trehalose-phosphatase [Actinomycetota bacterium]
MSDLPADLLDALERFCARPRVLAAFDFDGVLAPIVAEPSAARALPASADALAELTRLDDVVVALVSGRALADLRAVASPPEGVVLVASHGAEVAGAPPPDVPLDVLEQVVSGLEAVVAEHPGTAVELKPAAAVLHTRRAARDVAARATDAALAAAARVDGAHVMRGKEVVEVSVVQADKGSALVSLADSLGVDAVMYVGDDVTDEHAFAAVTARGCDDDVTVRVGDGDTAARYRVASPEAVTALLHQLLALRHRVAPSQ